MTLSIAVFDKVTKAAGVATATGGVSVGAFVPHVKAGVGAITTQGFFTNWLYGEEGLALLASGRSSEKTVKDLVGQDDGRAYRQCLVIDNTGAGAYWTGDKNVPHCEVLTAPGLVAGGNYLKSPGTAKAMIDAFQESKDQPLARRLLIALNAGVEAGGDSRGIVSAALKVDFMDQPPIDLRVDYAPGDTLKKITEVYDQYHRSPFKEFYESVPTRSDKSRCGPSK